MTRLRAWPAILACGAIGLATGAVAQVPTSTTCQTRYGICRAPVAPVGAPCACIGPRGPDSGRMIYAPAAQRAPQMQQVPLGNACRTPYGVCSLPFNAPLNAPCTCMGPRGPDQGNVIGGALAR